jgi:phosphatidylglycerophosphate synthase
MRPYEGYQLNRYRTAPNLLTLLRICLAPFLVAAILDNHYALSFGLFVAPGSPTRWMAAGSPAEAAPCWASTLTRWPTSCC